jgi:hypothetical protein
MDDTIFVMVTTVTPIDPAVAPTPGWSQRVIAVGIAVLGALPSSGLFGPTSTALKLAGLAIVGLAAAGYGTSAAAIKTAHAAGRRSTAASGATS